MNKKFYIGICTLFLVLLGAATSTQGETIVVTNIRNSGAGSLRQAVIDANALAGDDIIVFSSLFSTPQTILLGGGEIELSSNITIHGTGANLLTVRNTAANSRVFKSENGTVYLNGMTISGGTGNLTGAGIYIYKDGTNICTMTLNNCAISDNHTVGDAGGIYIGAGATLNIHNSTISGNSSNGSAPINAVILNSDSTLNVHNSTISGNATGGIYSSGFDNVVGIVGTTTITNSTIANNAGSGGVQLDDGGTVTIRNSIVAKNQGTSGSHDVSSGGGMFISSGFNLIGNVGSVTAFNQAYDQTGTPSQMLDPRIAPLKLYGGTTRTHALLPNSPAVDKGFNFGSTSDQRGFTRPFDNAGIPNNYDGTDIGAFEHQAVESIFSAPFDFDGDGKTDIGIFRPPVAEWWIQRSSNAQIFAAQFGASTDRITPGDFTGDGKTDVAFWRPSTGYWFVLRSEDFSFFAFPFGTNGDIPAPADFDGDGKADAAVFRPTDTNWYIMRSSDGGITIRQFGANGDSPVPADFDGDGKADIAIWRPAGGQWWINRSSSDAIFAFQFGTATDKATQGDYTGDGKADLAFWRPSTGFWFILRSEDLSFFSFPFGTNGDVPAPGDYDGDAKFDASVFRPSNNVWYIQKSTAGILIQGFGIAGDKPVPNAFVP